MAGSCWLIAHLSAAALVVLTVTELATAICSQQQIGKRDVRQQLLQQQWIDPCFGPNWCRRFPFARCRVQDCTEARFFVGDTDVTDHCDVDNCEVENGEDINCNGLCVIDPLPGTPVCLPSCDFNNGGCEDDEVCVIDSSFLCVRFPCPQPVRCIHKNGFCNQKPATDSCGNSEQAFFYNSTTQRCERFVYGGCVQSFNHFSTRRDCRRTCRGVPDVCFNSIRCPPGTRCMANERGVAYCQASCKYENGGCEEDEICRSVSTRCLVPPCLDTVECIPRADVCSQPPEVGFCRGAFPRYFYNYTTGRCDSFTYGGCGGNDNNFISVETCQETCSGVNPCDLVKCPMGFTCEVNANGETDCVTRDPCLLNPSICDPCRRVSCPTGTTCNGVTGRAQCIPNDACTNFTCEAGFNCRVDQLTGRPGCVIGTFACAAILCPIDTICRVRPGTQTGFCGRDPCETHTCTPDMDCRFNQAEDTAQCIPRPIQANPCLSAICFVGHTCVVDSNGNADCVPITPQDPCADTECEEPNICRINPVTKQAFCGADPCLSSSCNTPYECQYNRTTDSGECVPSAPCFMTSCPSDEICRFNRETREGRCGVRDIRCGGSFQCPPGTSCNVDRGIMTSVRCISNDDPCANIDCGPDPLYICRRDPISGAGYCGINFCTLVRCGFNTECRYDPVTDDAGCQPNPCRTTTCATGTVCRISEEGLPECVNPCEGVICGTRMCRVNPESQAAYCGVDPCIHTSCRERGTECRYNMETDQSECVLANPCAFTTCPIGNRCEVDSTTGQAKCVLDLPDFRCFLLQCAAGFVCRVGDDGNVQCVPDDQNPCDNVICGLQMCRIHPLTRIPYCGVDPCTSTLCPQGRVCRYNTLLDFGICVLPVDPCENIVCTDDDQVCEVDGLTNQPRCVDPPDPCEGILCSGGDICRISPRTRTTFCGITPCAFTTCLAPSDCVYDPETDTGRCVRVDNPSQTVCLNVNCPPDTRCEANERSVAECVNICSETPCGRPLVCRVNATTRQPYCGAFPCRNFPCLDSAQSCQYNAAVDRPICAPIEEENTAPCDPNPCPRDTGCSVNTRRNAECLPIVVG